MPEFLELIETIKGEDADVKRIFSADDGKGIRSLTKRESPIYMARLVEAADFVAEIATGQRPVHHFTEAMTTSDFPLLFGDILDRMVLGGYREYPKNWQNFSKVETVSDFRLVSRHFWDGGMATLAEVPERTEYPEAALSEGRYQYSVKKYGRVMDFSWEMMINNDLNFFNDIPQRFGTAAARSEAKFVTDLYIGTAGPDATFFSVGNNNIVTANPVLSIAGLQTAMQKLGAQTDSDGHPIFIETVELVVPPALEITALNILNAIQLE
ncbi:MAG: hypothetical protein ACRD1T_13285, partial [Acidimicrobiia bacterium]